MKIHYILFFLPGLIGLQSCKNDKNMQIEPPKAEKIKRVLSVHGHDRIDYYYWLNDRDNPKVIEYLNAENKYLEEVLQPQKEFREKLYNEIVGRIKQTDMTVPYKSNGFWYFQRFDEGQEYPLICRKKDKLENPEEIMLNVNILAKDFKFFDMGHTSVSPENNLLAYSFDTVGNRKYIIRFKDMSSGNFFPDEIGNTMGNIVWANDNKTVFYTIKDEALRGYKVMKHVIGNRGNKDVEVYHEPDALFSAFVYKTKSKQYILVGSASTTSTELQYIKADEPDSKFKLFHPREKNHEYWINHYGDSFYISTNQNAKNFRLMTCGTDNTSKENWVELIPHRDDVMLINVELFKNYMVVQERKNGLTQIRIIDWKDRSEHYLNFGEAAYTTDIGTNPDFETDLLRFSYTSMTTPLSIYDYNMKSRKKTLLKQEEVLGKFNSEDYKTERLYVTASDGVKVPVSLVYRKDLKKKRGNPLLLYGYGSYGISMDPSFVSARLSLLNRGFIFAIAHIRGGEEMGRAWYEDGKFLKKKNTFTDYIACAEYLLEQKYTTKDQLYGMGGSAGGLLIGAVANMRPDLFHGLVAAVPFVDVVTTMLDESIPLTVGEFEEWGNPKDKEYYDYMLSYSPYDNVKAMDYPNLLVTTGLYDSQVPYWEPAKWVAKLRDMKTDDKLLLFYINMDTGHGGASGRFEKYKEYALEYTFLLMLEGIEE